MSKNVKVADLFNGWESEAMTEVEARKYINTHNAPTPRDIVPADAEWRYDSRFGEWAWFDGAKRIS